jgi:SAM-dependent methyltransferase
VTESIYEHPHDYELEHEGEQDDVRFFRSLIGAYRPPRTVELGCGSGRVTIPLVRAAAHAGGDVIGIDQSETMLAACQARRQDLPDAIRRRLTLIRADILRWSVASPVELVVVPGSSIRHLLSLDDQLAFWRRAHDNLEPGGRLVVDVSMPNLPAYAESLRVPPRRVVELDLDASDRVSGERLVRYCTTEYVPHEQRARIRFVYDKFAPHAEPDPYLSDFDSHVYYPRELRLLFLHTGFVIDAVFGDYRRGPLHAASREMVVVGRRRGRAELRRS